MEEIEIYFWCQKTPTTTVNPAFFPLGSNVLSMPNIVLFGDDKPMSYYEFNKSNIVRFKFENEIFQKNAQGQVMVLNYLLPN